MIAPTPEAHFGTHPHGGQYYANPRTEQCLDQAEELRRLLWDRLIRLLRREPGVSIADIKLDERRVYS